MLKAIVEVYSELSVTNFYAQIFCNRHSKFVKIIRILMHRTVSAVFVYISFPAFIKLFWLAKVFPQTQVKSNGPTQFCTTTANSKSKKVFWFRHRALVIIFITTISDVFAHASYKCPVNSYFEWPWISYNEAFIPK